MDLDAALARRTPKPLRAVLLLLTLLLGLLPVWLSAAGPLEAALDQSREVRIAANISAGAVSVDGRMVSDRLPLTLRLAPGRHTVALDAAAFLRRECRVTVPGPGPDDTCMAAQDATAAGGGGALTVTIALSAADLLPGQLPSVRAALEDGLRARLVRLGVDVAPGEWYAVGAADGESQATARRASEPLRAIPAAALSAVPGDSACGAPLCAELSDQEGVRADASSGVVWRMRAGVTLGWDFATGTGAAAGQMRYPAGLGGPTVVLALAYDAKGGWRVLGDAASGRALEAQVAEGLCADAEAALLAAHPKRLLLVAAGPSTLEGCALKIRWAVNRQRAELAGEVVCRFGAVLAADMASQALFPQLEPASDGERAAAGG